VSVCPICERQQDLGLVCHACVTVLERDLAEVRALMGELDVTASKQARIGGGGKGAPARERSPINWGGVEAADVLTNTLTTWARDVGGRTIVKSRPAGPAVAACMILMRHIDAIRRHPAANELFDEITDAIKQARRAVDRPADRVYLGQCMVETPDEDGRQVTCLAELFSRPQASEVSCRVCGAEHEVGERRAWLMQRAKDMIVTVKEAATFIGEVGGIKVSQSSIRGYLHRGRIAYRPGVTNGIRLGDLLAVVLDDSERKGAA